MIKRFITKVKNIFNWIVFLWKSNDAPWDNYFLWNVMQFKLDQMIVSNRKSSVKHEGQERSVERMQLVSNLLEKIKEEYYQIEYFDYYEIKINFDPIENTKHSKLNFTVIRDDLEEFFKKNKLLHKKVITEVGAGKGNNLIAMYICERKHKKALHLLCRLLERHVEEWWW